MKNLSLQPMAIDVHCHPIFTSFVESLRKHDALQDEGFPLSNWSVAQQLEFMDAAGIQLAVLTPPAPQPYFGNSKECASIMREQNEAMARIKSENPHRFLFGAGLPLPDVDAAIRELHYAMDVLHADGVKLATNSRGQYVGEPELDSLMEELDKYHAVAILHPHKPTPYKDSLMGITPLAMGEYLAETTRCLQFIISRNLLVRYPHIRIVVPHCGAYLPLAIPRMQSIYSAVHAAGLMGEVDWQANLSHLYFDLAGYPSLEVRTLLTLTTPDHLLYGSDYPYVKSEVLVAKTEKLWQDIAKYEHLSAILTDIQYKNVARLFNQPYKKN